ncbi:LOW QUALITY PROTEIN: hypothetical protein V2J09_019795 [Rumex salicifolius]
MTETKAMNEKEKAFRKIDTNDERISTLELQSLQLLLRSLRSDASTKEAEIDKDSDGHINFNDFAGDEEDDLRWHSTKDNNGLISASELQAVLRNIGHNMSGDGHVNYDELRKMML